MLQNLVVRRLKLEDEAAFRKALAAWGHHPSFMFAPGFTSEMGFSEYLELLDANERGERLQAGYVPITLLAGFVNGEIVGRLNLRHRLTDHLLKSGGHIGYGVVPSFRRQGVAKALLTQSLTFARELGIVRALLTCNEDNIGSAKTIEACGGVRELVPSERPGAQERRYWIDLAD